MNIPVLIKEQLQAYRVELELTRDLERGRQLLQEVGKHRWPDEGEYFPVLKVVGRGNTCR